MRCFIAVDIPESAKAKIFHEFETLKNKNLFRGTIVDKENLHLTLKFLGEISEERINELIKRLDGVKHKNFDGKIGNIGVFDSWDFLKVVWVEFISNEINELENLIECSLKDIPCDKTEKFIPHITLARIKSVIDKEKLVNELQKIKFSKMDFKIDKFVLMKSELINRKVVYKIIKEFKLN